MCPALESGDLGGGGRLWHVDPRGAPLEGGGWPAQVHADDATLVEGARRAALGAGTSYRVEYRLASGTPPVWVLEWARPLRDAAGGFRGLTGATVELGAQAAVLESRRRALDTLDAFVHASPLAVIVMDDASRVQLWNPAAERMFGWSEAEVLGRINPLVPLDRRGEARRIRDRILSGETLSEVEIRRQRKDGTTVELSACAAPIRDPDGRVRGLVGVLSDISERKRLESQLRHAQKMDALGRLAAGVAHDFNNLLTAISGFGELALRQVGAEHAARRHLEEIRKAAGRASSLTRQLLAFSRKQPVAPRVVDLNRLVTDLETMLRRLLGERIELAVASAPEPALVLADPGQLEQVAVNLVVNARDAMPDGGQVAIQVALDGTVGTPAESRESGAGERSVSLTVSDTGCGMDAETRSRIFEPFFTTKAEGKGTGLGLATVYGIVRQSGGEIAVESTPGAGSTFRVRLPWASGAEAAEAPMSVTPIEGAETVLVVEDDEQVRALACSALTQAGYRALSAPDPDSALSLVERHPGPLHLLLADLALPRASGHELATRLRAVRPRLRVLYMSGYAPEVIRAGEPGGPGIGMLEKPFTVEALLRQVRRCLDPPEAAAA